MNDMSDILDLKCFTIDGDFYEGEHLVSPGFHIDACMYKPSLQMFFGVCEEKYTTVESERTRFIIGSVFHGNNYYFLKLSDNERILPLFYNVSNNGASYVPFKVACQRALRLKQRDTDANLIIKPNLDSYNKADVIIGKPEPANKEKLSCLFSELENFLVGTTLQNRLLFFDYYSTILCIIKELSYEQLWNIN